MEREASIEERIRRAEEIYSRRNGIQIKSKKEKKHKPLKKLFMQILVCFFIYLIIYVINNSNYIFSQEFLNNNKDFFKQNTNIYNIYTNVKNNILEKLSPAKEEFVENNTQNTNTESNTADENLSIVQNNIGGAEESNITDSALTNSEENKTQMEMDAEDIKSNINFIIPLEGRISSTFGWRTPTTSTVPKYHTGLDIAANTGTVIKSATDGEVIISSKEGDYGNHLEIQNGNVLIVYGHCSKLYLTQGEHVKQGQEIAEVGSTGNSTGPHLHFEIRKDGRYVDPQLIIDI